MKYPFFVALSLLGLLTVPASADLKIGVVDYVRVAKEYYKTKDATVKLQDRATRAQQELQDREDDLRKMMVDTNKLGEDANDKSLSDSVRQDKLKAFNTQKDAFIQERSKFEQQKADLYRKIQDFDRMTAQEILMDVTKTVKDYAAREKYSLILNSGEAGQSAYGQLTVISYSSDIRDVSDDIIKALNANAPAPSASPSPAASTPTAPASTVAPSPVPTK